MSAPLKQPSLKLATEFAPRKFAIRSPAIQKPEFTKTFAGLSKWQLLAKPRPTLACRKR